MLACTAANTTTPEIGTRTWPDIRRIDVPPDLELAKVTTRTGPEVAESAE